MERHDTKLEDEALLIEWDDEWVEIGPLDAVLDLFDGETYEIEYDDAQSKVPWLESDLEDNTLSFDVVETVTDMDFDDEFTEEVVEAPLDSEGNQGHPLRTETFVAKMIEIWEAQGASGEGEALGSGE
ncbi:Uncharacterized protein SVXHr_2291 [Halorhabdus sp. SVX81]|uniref:hypothetical protein n=1 Tax=Halorhabdus sp. SVX81 TaxID=2978283 RepID=UPI0023DAB260|nr:hypothetical protein [Halorhabdus sp. SVX81]WEL18444.1 Uncharacterized protein SVXHr_2291 [Halorhabdus sp. SVX81]